MLHVCNNFFAMFVRSDLTPNLNDPIILWTIVGTLLVYSFSSIVLLYQRNQQLMKEDDYSTIVLSQGEKEDGTTEGTEWRDGRRASVGLLRMDADNSSVNNEDGDDGEDGDGEEDVQVVSKNGLSPIVFGICFGIVIYAVLLR